MNGAKIAVKCLEAQGVDTVFGYPGASILPFIDALTREKKKIRLCVNTMEEFCAFSADGYARSTGKTGVCFATSGPGATNLVTGLANAYMDSIPLVAVTGNVPLSLLGTDAFQETDIAGVTMPVTKHNFIVKSVSQLEKTLADAFAIAGSGRKGPVLVDIPVNIFSEETKYLGLVSASTGKNDEVKGDIASVSELINRASRPLVCVGGGVIASGAFAETESLVSRLACPVVSTAMGIGAYDGRKENYCGIIGMNAESVTSELLGGSDLLIAIGTRFSDRMIESVRRNPDCRIVQIDIDDAEIDKNLSPCGALIGDAAAVLRRLLPLLTQRSGTPKLRIRQSERNAFSLINGYFPDAIITTEVGLHQVDACRGLKIASPRSFLTSGGLGAMGYGLPAAIGALIGNPGKKAINIAGDGSFNMNMQELATAKRYSLPVIQLVMNNRSLGMISKWQDEHYGGRTKASDTPEIDYCVLASAFGIEAFRAESEDELESVFASLTSLTDRPVLIDYNRQEPL